MRNVVGVAVAALLVAAPAWADAYIPGWFNDWSQDPMTETSPGFYEYDIPVQDPDAWRNFVLLAEAENWDTKYIPSGDQWCFTDATGNLHITFDTNTYDDGWFPQTNRVGVSNWTGAWTAVGDWQHLVGGGDWDPNNPNTVMTEVGGGLFKFELTGLSAGEHYYKAVHSGTWDAIGGDGLSVNADNLAFAVNDPSEIVTFWVDASSSILMVDVVPEPASLALLALGGLLALRRR